MTQRYTAAPMLLTAGLAALALLGACASHDPAMDTLDADMVAPFATFEPGVVQGWTTATTNPRDGEAQAVWQVLSGEGAPSLPNSVALVNAMGHAGQTFNLFWDPAISLKDVDLTVTVRADGGEEDQGGGPAWRIGSDSDYYVARWNPLEDNFRVYSVVGGERLQLATAKVHVDPDSWHTIRIQHIGSRIKCSFDGDMLLDVIDSKLPEAGGVGVWTKADALTSFHNFGYKKAGV